MEISVVCVAARLVLDASLERCLEARVALGAVAPTAVRAHAAERLLEGQPVGAEAFRRAAEAAQESCRPIDDVRASATFRQHLVGVLVRRALDRVRRAGARGPPERGAPWPGSRSRSRSTARLTKR